MTPLEYAKAACDTMMRKFEAAKLLPEGHFHYHQGVFLSGMYQTYQLCKDERYFQYIKDWVDSIIDENAVIHTYDPGQLDDIQPGVLLYPLLDRTNDPRYKKALDELVDVVYNFPRNAVGGFFHKEWYPHQMWLDGLYMGGPIAAEYGYRFNRPDFIEICIEQALLMRKMTEDKETGLWYHAWDCLKETKWADPQTGLSPEFWGRAMGWVPVAICNELDFIPQDHPKREELCALVRDLLTALCKFQSEDGRWYQVVNKGDREDNWLENSCSCLYTAAICKAVRKGILDKAFLENAKRGYAGVINSLTWEGEDLQIGHVCIGTGVGDYTHYINRPVSINDLHGVGAFLIMCTEMEFSKKTQALNPYLPSWEYIPDGEPYVFGDRVYVYGSHDFSNGHAFCLGDYVCWSAPVDDLGNWRYEGIIYPKTSDPFNKDGKMCLYAPDVTVGPDGRYYLYYVLDKVNVVSVAVCDTPAGTYQFLDYVRYEDGTRLGEKPGDEPQFDPGVLTEGENTYLYTGFCGRGDKSRTGAFVTVLGPDMITIKEAPKRIAPGCEYGAGTSFEGHEYFEAASIRKHGDTYYFVYSSVVMHELCYATSKSPTEGFVYGGVLVSNCDLHIDTYKPADMPVAYGANNHGSIVEINGQWYIFYHRQTNGTWFSRQGCAEPIQIEEDGFIPQAEITSCGLNGGPLVGEGEYPAYIACHLFYEKQSMYVGDPYAPKIVQDGKDGDEELGYIVGIRDTATMGFKYFDCRGVKEISLTVRAYCNGRFEVRTAWDGPVLATIPVRSSNVWETYRAEFPVEDGVYALYFTYRGTGDPQVKSFGFTSQMKKNEV